MSNLGHNGFAELKVAWVKKQSGNGVFSIKTLDFRWICAKNIEKSVCFIWKLKFAGGEFKGIPLAYQVDRSRSRPIKNRVAMNPLGQTPSQWDT